MKEILNKLLNLLSKDRVDIVEERFHSAIKEGEEVYINGGWGKWIGSHDERTLTHVKYLDRFNTVRKHTIHSGMFLVRVKL
ncbi:hypothetical protein [Lelliottia wanjuensis]|uniref:hypothetical protein n=1 Tax=Lelliottia wanjuensis TaxID=3050585 RepID=UPI00254E9F2B|nr:hypothetical protein [Lelliottia sp. V86_10]MDK9585867.1 hypothetical protein [Lelliottia sp. V86_10]